MTQTSTMEQTFASEGWRFLYLRSVSMQASAASSDSKRTKPYPLQQVKRERMRWSSEFDQERTHVGLSDTCLVNVLTLVIAPNSLVILYNCSSGKLGGSPLM
jgi:hypothetical protein